MVFLRQDAPAAARRRLRHALLLGTGTGQTDRRSRGNRDVRVLRNAGPMASRSLAKPNHYAGCRAVTAAEIPSEARGAGIRYGRRRRGLGGARWPAQRLVPESRTAGGNI